MPTVCIQFQPHRAPGAETQILNAFRQNIPSVKIDEHNADAPYVNITFTANSPAEVLPLLHPILHSPTLGHLARSSCIITCEGSHGWNDYLLLHHFDRTLILDAPPTNPT